MSSTVQQQHVGNHTSNRLAWCISTLQVGSIAGSAAQGSVIKSSCANPQCTRVVYTGRRSPHLMAAEDACDRTWCTSHPKDAVRCQRGRKTRDTWTTLVPIHNVHLRHALNVRLYLAHKHLLSCASRQSAAICWIMTVLHTPHVHSQTQWISGMKSESLKHSINEWINKWMNE